jgi:hypothetical protein
MQRSFQATYRLPHLAGCAGAAALISGTNRRIDLGKVQPVPCHPVDVPSGCCFSNAGVTLALDYTTSWPELNNPAVDTD